MSDPGGISPVTFWLGTVLPAVMILAAFALSVAGFFHSRKARWWRRQPVAPGVVVKSEIYRGRRHDFGTHIIYRFEVGGRVYESRKFFLGQESVFYSAKKAREKIAPYPVGKPLSVHYDPENPHESVVVAESLAKYYYWGAFGIAAGTVIWAANFWAIELFAK